jgi:hypothetical protein
LGESKEAAIGYVPDVVPPAPEDGEPPADVVPPERVEVERRVAGLRVDAERDDRDEPDEPDVPDDDDRDEPDVDRDGVDDEERDDEEREAPDDDRDGADDEDRDDDDREAPDADRAEPDADRDDERDEVARDEAGLRVVEEDAPEAIFRVPDAVERRARGFLPVDELAGVRRAGVERPSGPTSSSETRFARPSTSLRKPLSSSRTRSSSTSRMRFAAAVTSFARPRVDLAPSAEAVKVRSTAARTASTASAAPAAAFLPLFFESFLAMAARS